ncbi:hypothetical protein TNCV_4856521 [Trichonephila clavipes]|nr:hypothetical protein TNCV_4856521 [Trichonephila clavipes]
MGGPGNVRINRGSFPVSKKSRLLHLLRRSADEELKMRLSQVDTAIPFSVVQSLQYQFKSVYRRVPSQQRVTILAGDYTLDLWKKK